MASMMTQAVPTYNGEPQSDVNMWIRDFETMMLVSRVPQDDIPRAAIMALRGQALSWASDFLQRVEVIEWPGLRRAMEARFNSTKRSDKILHRFTYAKPSQSAEEYETLLKDAAALVNIKLLTTEHAIKSIITKAPESIRATLWSRHSEDKSWDRFMQEAYDLSWVAFPERAEEAQVVLESRRTYNLAPVRSSNSESRPGKKQFYCKWHGSNPTHDSVQCKNLKRAKALGMSFPAGANAIEAPELNFEPYSVLRLGVGETNPFRTTAQIGELTVEALLDTGADISVINKAHVPRGAKMKPTDRKVVAANGTPLKIIGQIQNLTIRLRTRQIILDVVVAESEPKYVVIGADALARHPEILKEATDKVERQRSPLKPEQVVAISEEPLIEKFDQICRNEISRESICTTIEHVIDTGTAKPIAQRSSRVPVNYEQAIDVEIDKSLKLGIIAPSSSPWCARIVPVPKKDGALRICIDYRALNQITCKDNYQMPRIDDILDSLAQARIFTTLDATSGYHQIALTPESRAKTAFGWKNNHYEFNRMPFGLCNAPATFQRAMDLIIRNELGIFVRPYLDDIVVYSRTAEEHRVHLETVLGRLKAAGIVLNKKKCVIGQPAVKLLGNIVTEGKVMSDPDKVKAIEECERPKTLRELRSFLGLANYCRDYVRQFAHIASPLFELLKGASKDSVKTITWSETASQSFEEVKQAIKAQTERAQPDFSREFAVVTDASNLAVGGILAQKDEKGGMRMIYAFSKTLNPAQKNYSTTDKELLAIVLVVQHFRHYLLGRHFNLYTDHRALAYLWEAADPSSRLCRWALSLQEYDFTPIYIKGETNAADFFSRQTPVVKPNTVAALRNNELTAEERKEVLQEYHLALGHGSSSNMKFAIKEKYSWSSMMRDIEEYCKSCAICTRGGLERVNTKNRVILTTRPNECWECDIIGRLVETNRAQKFIFVAIDHYSKWTETRAIENKDKETILKAIKELIIEKHGIPTKIISDVGTEFNNSLLLREMQARGIQWVFASPDHHQTVGAVERVNQTLFSKLKKLTNFGEISWNDRLEQATIAVNMSFHKGLRTSPYIFKHGFLPDLKCDAKHGKVRMSRDRLQAKHIRDLNYDHYTEKSIVKGKREINKEFPIGAQVAIFKRQKGDKFMNEWFIGYVVTEKLDPDAYIVMKDGKSYRLNKSHLKRDFSSSGGDVATGI
ncbi:hypothetical protein PAPHI01_2615 [Pancytospora philotis]|nr:hypothetical protein PAPHI01_2615 [Pancytospora philotis]